MSDKRAAYITGLRALADVLESNPAVPLPFYGDEDSPVLMGFYDTSAREDMAAAARVFPCAWEKSVSGTDSQWFNLTGALGGGLYVQLYAAREQVCTRRVVGTEEREVEETVTPAVTRKVTKTVEVVEWDCGSLLRPEAGVTP